jgi:carbamoyltransferase
MNCKANGRILDDGDIQELFVHPACSDDGSAIGAAFHAARAYDRLLPNPLKHTQVGPAFPDAEIEKALQVAGVPYTTPTNIAERTAELLADGNLCGWFQGGLEMGARALGGRSIVACPQARDVRTRMNCRVKFREAWRPYCPSLTAESSAIYLARPVDTPFMIVARTATETLAERGPATVHVDRTVRPQTVQQDVLPLWHYLLSEIERRTGDPVLLNTSFNVRGEPIVCTPSDAIRCFYGSGLDALAIGAFLVRKSGTGIDHV